ncbi:rhodanese-like domain-containing protein [Desulforhopalus singaporensis]|uniref:3-mercaptopyruvate sulfurtransferase SseA, contains two rhodanese domains n=1 Tax=Desulforhopalus singaporensis TaxID=91360 RepID=A0A1H0NE17_9BACT|nr:rhodanese-like domain-containing protein [Desulforhopalus singaporensis]SDO90893.1 3-mercaptopyruvate sulfurtransferase SseA, contains two rhodanese domains [Desulforhopalus singaporensis]
MSPKSAGLAVKWGHKTPLVYKDGLPSWKKSGHRTVPTMAHIAKGNVVIVDLRDAKSVEKGYIPRAYTVPFGELEDYEDAFPAAYGAPIYLYSDKDEEVSAATRIVKDWGYKNVNGFYGALDAWISSGRTLQQGPALTASDDTPIFWEKILGDGEISITDFTKSLHSELIFVVDARTPEEYESGHFPGSVSIPLELMKSRLSEIPKDKFIVVHCKTGGRGEIGYRLLKEEGYAVKFLNAECECDPSGEYNIW